MTTESELREALEWDNREVLSDAITELIAARAVIEVARLTLSAGLGNPIWDALAAYDEAGNG